MIIGKVNEHYEIVVPLFVQDADGNVHQFDAVVDTGFTGALTMPASLISALRLTRDSKGAAVMANAAIEEFDAYAATVVWDGVQTLVTVQAAETQPLLGMELLIGCRITAHFVKGGAVQIQRVAD